MRALERWLVLGVCVAVGWFYVWTVRSSGDAWNFGREQRDYYNLLIDGYLDGQLNMKVEVPPLLLTLKDPYDPAQRPPGVGLHDASFYKGKYYVYFGVAPMVALMLPFRVITGIDLPLAIAVLLFVYGGFLVSAAIWLAVRRRYFPETSTATVGLGVMVLGLAGVEPVLLRRPNMWELPIGGGYFFIMASLGFIWCSLHAARHRAWWFAGAALGLGLAIASRPTYLLASPFLAVPLLWWAWHERRIPWRMLAAAVGPLAVVGSLMAWHNQARFGSPLQFGQAYQFSLDYESKLPHFGPGYVPFNVRAHFTSGAVWTPYFPFIHRPDLGPAPQGFTVHRGDVYGLLVNFPVACLAFLAPLALWRRSKAERGPLAAWLGSVAVLFALAAAVLLSFFSALARYQMDFAPAFMLLAGVGWLALERWLRIEGRAPWRAPVRAGCLAAAVFSCVFGVIYSLQYEGLLAERNPRLERDVARRLNRFPAAFERLFGVRHGPVELTLRLPATPTPGRETILTSGDPPRVDRVFLRTLDDGRVQFGVALSESPEQLSRPLALDSRSAHRVRFALGSLYPPVSHPFFARMSPEEVRRTTRQLRLEVDGETVLASHQRARGVAAGPLRAGRDALVDSSYPIFRGEVSGVRRTGGDPAATAGEPVDFVRLRLAFREGPAGGGEPLLSFGDARGGMVLAATRVDGGRMTFGLAGTKAETLRSDPVAIEAGRFHDCTVTMEQRSPSRRRLYVRVDGGLAWAREVSWDAPAGAAVVPGKNVPRLAACGADFSGSIASIQHDPQGRDPLGGPGDTLRVRLTLPAKPPAGREPLVVTGRTGAGDMLLLEYPDAQTVRFALDHWGAPMRVSPPVRIDLSQPHGCEVAMTSLATFEDATAVRDSRWGRLQLKVDDAIVWEVEADFYAAEREEIAVGRNPIGGTSCGPAFTGDVLAAERVGRE